VLFPLSAARGAGCCHHDAPERALLRNFCPRALGQRRSSISRRGSCPLDSPGRMSALLTGAARVRSTHRGSCPLGSCPLCSPGRLVSARLCPPGSPGGLVPARLHEGGIHKSLVFFLPCVCTGLLTHCNELSLLRSALMEAIYMSVCVCVCVGGGGGFYGLWD